RTLTGCLSLAPLALAAAALWTAPTQGAPAKGASPTTPAPAQGASPSTSAPRGTAPRNVAIVLYEGVELLDFAGPAEVFKSAAGYGGGSQPAFRVYTVAATHAPLKSLGV